jgi:ubiquinone/menaquinone biosynthesis C-methylase UbiE
LDWHKRFLQQAAWTLPLRMYILRLIEAERARRILEVGCGTGALLEEMVRSWLEPAGSVRTLHGVDLSSNALSSAKQHAPAALLTCGNALDLPYFDKSFDIAFCHYLLLWVSDPGRALREMKRVTRSQGYVLAFGEPDYSARIDHPDDLALLGTWQAKSLQHQGAAVSIGRDLAELFDQSGLRIIETGEIEGWLPHALTPEGFTIEWDVLRQDLAGMASEAELNRMMELDRQARQNGTRILRVPMYFACGQV